MTKNIFTTLFAILFVWSQSSLAFAQNYHFNAFDHVKRDMSNSKINARGFTGQVGFTVPLGGHGKSNKKPFYGFKMTYGQQLTNGNPFDYGHTRDLSLFQSGFDKNGLHSLSLANNDLYYDGEQKNIFGNGNGNGNGLLWGTLLIGVGVGACWALGCFDSDDDSSS